MSETAYLLEKALLIYRGNEGCYFQYHDVFPNAKGSRKPPVLGAGRPLTREALLTLCRAVLPTLTTDVEYLDESVLVRGQTAFGPEVWWSPPKVQAIFFGSHLKVAPGKAPWPGMILCVKNGQLSIWAVKGNQRPKPDTRLYIAPFFNMTGESICLGSARHPKKGSDHAGWEEALFKSAFTEERQEIRVSGDKLLSTFWSRLIREKATRFPENRLIESQSPKTLKNLIEWLKGDKL